MRWRFHFAIRACPWKRQVVFHNSNKRYSHLIDAQAEHKLYTCNIAYIPHAKQLTTLLQRMERLDTDGIVSNTTIFTFLTQLHNHSSDTQQITTIIENINKDLDQMESIHKNERTHNSGIGMEKGGSGIKLASLKLFIELYKSINKTQSVWQIYFKHFMNNYNLWLSVMQSYLVKMLQLELEYESTGNNSIKWAKSQLCHQMFRCVSGVASLDYNQREFVNEMKAWLIYINSYAQDEHSKRKYNFMLDKLAQIENDNDTKTDGKKIEKTGTESLSDKIVEEPVAVLNAQMYCYLMDKNGGDKALEIYDKITDKTLDTFVNGIIACTKTKNIDKGIEIHNLMVSQNRLKLLFKYVVLNWELKCAPREKQKKEHQNRLYVDTVIVPTIDCYVIQLYSTCNRIDTAIKIFNDAANHIEDSLLQQQEEKEKTSKQNNDINDSADSEYIVRNKIWSLVRLYATMAKGFNQCSKYNSTITAFTKLCTNMDTYITEMAKVIEFNHLCSCVLDACCHVTSKSNENVTDKDKNNLKNVCVELIDYLIFKQDEDVKEKEKEKETLTRKKIDPKLYVKLIDCYAACGDYNLAKDTFDKGIKYYKKIGRENTPLWAALMRAEHSDNRSDTVLELFDRIVRVHENKVKQFRKDTNSNNNNSNNNINSDNSNSRNNIYGIFRLSWEIFVPAIKACTDAMDTARIKNIEKILSDNKILEKLEKRWNDDDVEPWCQIQRALLGYYRIFKLASKMENIVSALERKQVVQMGDYIALMKGYMGVIKGPSELKLDTIIHAQNRVKNLFIKCLKIDSERNNESNLELQLEHCVNAELLTTVLECWNRDVDNSNNNNNNDNNNNKKTKKKKKKWRNSNNKIDFDQFMTVYDMIVSDIDYDNNPAINLELLKLFAHFQDWQQCHQLFIKLMESDDFDNKKIDIFRMKACMEMFDICDNFLSKETENENENESKHQGGKSAQKVKNAIMGQCWKIYKGYRKNNRFKLRDSQEDRIRLICFVIRCLIENGQDNQVEDLYFDDVLIVGSGLIMETSILQQIVTSYKQRGNPEKANQYVDQFQRKTGRKAMLA